MALRAARERHIRPSSRVHDDRRGATREDLREFTKFSTVRFGKLRIADIRVLPVN